MKNWGQLQLFHHFSVNLGSKLPLEKKKFDLKTLALCNCWLRLKCLKPSKSKKHTCWRWNRKSNTDGSAWALSHIVKPGLTKYCQHELHCLHTVKTYPKSVIIQQQYWKLTGQYKNWLNNRRLNVKNLPFSVHKNSPHEQLYEIDSYFASEEGGPYHYTKGTIISHNTPIRGGRYMWIWQKDTRGKK